MSCPHPTQPEADQRSSRGHTPQCPGPALTDQQSSLETDVVFQIPGFKKPPGNLSGTIKNVSLRAAACRKQATGQGHKNPVPATPLPVALRLPAKRTRDGGWWQRPPCAGMRTHICASGHAWGGLCLSTLARLRCRGPSPMPR